MQETDVPEETCHRGQSAASQISRTQRYSPSLSSQRRYSIVKGCRTSKELNIDFKTAIEVLSPGEQPSAHPLAKFPAPTGRPVKSSQPLLKKGAELVPCPRHPRSITGRRIGHGAEKRASLSSRSASLRLLPSCAVTTPSRLQGAGCPLVSTDVHTVAPRADPAQRPPFRQQHANNSMA